MKTSSGGTVRRVGSNRAQPQLRRPAVVAVSPGQRHGHMVASGDSSLASTTNSLFSPVAPEARSRAQPAAAASRTPPLHRRLPSSTDVTPGSARHLRNSPAQSSRRNNMQMGATAADASDPRTPSPIRQQQHAKHAALAASAPAKSTGNSPLRPQPQQPELHNFAGAKTPPLSAKNSFHRSNKVKTRRSMIMTDPASFLKPAASPMTGFDAFDPEAPSLPSSPGIGGMGGGGGSRHSLGGSTAGGSARGSFKHLKTVSSRHAIGLTSKSRLHSLREEAMTEAAQAAQQAHNPNSSSLKSSSRLMSMHSMLSMGPTRTDSMFSMGGQSVASLLEDPASDPFIQPATAAASPVLQAAAHEVNHEEEERINAELAQIWLHGYGVDESEFTSMSVYAEIKLKELQDLMIKREEPMPTPFYTAAVLSLLESVALRLSKFAPALLHLVTELRSSIYVPPVPSLIDQHAALSHASRDVSARFSAHAQVEETARFMPPLLHATTFYAVVQEQQRKIDAYAKAEEMARRNRMRDRLRNGIFARMSGRFNNVMMWAVFQIWREQAKQAKAAREASLAWLRRLLQPTALKVEEVFQAWKALAVQSAHDRALRRCNLLKREVANLKTTLDMETRKTTQLTKALGESQAENIALKAQLREMKLNSHKTPLVLHLRKTIAQLGDAIRNLSSSALVTLQDTAQEAASLPDAANLWQVALADPAEGTMETKGDVGAGSRDKPASPTKPKSAASRRGAEAVVVSTDVEGWGYDSTLLQMALHGRAGTAGSRRRGSTPNHRQRRAVPPRPLPLDMASRLGVMDRLAALTPQETLLRWVNYHLLRAEQAGLNPGHLRVDNLDYDLRDGHALLLVMQQIAGKKAPSFSQDPLERAEKVVKQAAKLQPPVAPFILPGHIADGQPAVLGAFVAELFSTHPGLQAVDGEGAALAEVAQGLCDDWVALVPALRVCGATEQAPAEPLLVSRAKGPGAPTPRPRVVLHEDDVAHQVDHVHFDAVPQDMGDAEVKAGDDADADADGDGDGDARSDADSDATATSRRSSAASSITGMDELQELVMSQHGGSHNSGQASRSSRRSKRGATVPFKRFDRSLLDEMVPCMQPHQSCADLTAKPGIRLRLDEASRAAAEADLADFDFEGLGQGVQEDVITLHAVMPRITQYVNRLRHAYDVISESVERSRAGHRYWHQMVAKVTSLVWNKYYTQLLNPPLPQPWEDEYLVHLNIFCHVDKQRVKDVLRVHCKTDEERTSQIEGMEALLTQHCKELSMIFKYYSHLGISGGNGATMTSLEFWKFVKDIKVAEKGGSSANEIDLIYAYATSASDADARVMKSMSPSGWVTSLIRLAVFLFCETKKGGHKSGTTVEGALETLLMENVLPMAMRTNAVQFRKEIHTPLVREVLATYRLPLVKVFSFYADSDKSSSKNKNTLESMEFGDFMRLLRDCNMYDRQLTEVIARSVFSNAQSDDAEATSHAPGPGAIGFKEFQELLCALATFRQCNPYWPIHYRLTAFLTDNLLPNAKIGNNKRAARLIKVVMRASSVVRNWKRSEPPPSSPGKPRSASPSRRRSASGRRTPPAIEDAGLPATAAVALPDAGDDISQAISAALAGAGAGAGAGVGMGMGFSGTSSAIASAAPSAVPSAAPSAVPSTAPSPKAKGSALRSPTHAVAASLEAHGAVQ